MSTGSLWQEIAFDLLVPFGMALLIALSSRGWAHIVQGSSISERTRRRQKAEFWIVLCVLYAMSFGIFCYAHFVR